MKNYDRIGKEYDETRCADSFLVSRLAHYLDINRSANYLDAACGTGNYTVTLAKLTGGVWHGIDCSARMIEKARGKSNSVQWQLAEISALPFPAEFFAGAICTLAIHHFESLSKTFSEIHRVLKPEGKFIIFTATPEQTLDYWLAEYFPLAIQKSALVLPAFETISDALYEAGFRRLNTEPYAVREDLQDLFLYSGKHKPEIYLNEKIRRNISTFALLADEREVENGCRRLAADIASGRINSIIERHKNSSDYLFIIASA